MGLLVKDDKDYDESIRMTGFNRYKQLLSSYAGHWTKLNIITTISMLPLVFFISFSLLNQSILLMIPLSFLGGIIAGPFISALFDSIQRGLRDDPNRRWKNYKKGLKQNLTCSIIPGGFFGLIAGSYSFMFYMMYCGVISPSPATIVLIIFTMFLSWDFFILYWIQLVLFSQPFMTTMRNIILFTSKYLWKMIMIAFISLLFITLIVLFAPLTLIFVPFISWYLLFLSQFIIYDCLNVELKIEEAFEHLQN